MNLGNIANLNKLKVGRLWLPVALIMAAILLVGGVVFAATLSNTWQSPTVHVVQPTTPPSPTPEQLPLELSSPDFTGDRTLNPLGTTQFGVNLKNPSLTGSPAYEDVRVRIEVSKTTALAADDVTLQYYSGSAWLPLPVTLTDGKLVGYFGPDTGFDVPAQYNVTTPIKATFKTLGDYSAQAWVEAVASVGS